MKSKNSIAEIIKIPFKYIFQLIKPAIIDKIIFFNNGENPVFEIKDGNLAGSSDQIKNIKNCLLSDSLLEMKLITLPVVSGSLLKNIVINTIKKHSAVIPDQDHIDYRIIEKTDNQYQILVFLKRFTQDDEGNRFKYYSVYHIIEVLLKDGYFPEDSSFLVNSGNEWFLYIYKEKKFKKRVIYYDEDISTIKGKNIYFINLFNDIKKSAKAVKSFNEIPFDKIVIALKNLKKSLFIKPGKFSSKNIIIIAMISVVLIIALFFEYNRISLHFNKKSLTSEYDNRNKIFEKEKSTRGVTDEIYTRYMTLFSKKSHLNDFFHYLYLTSRDNVEIQRINYNNGKFSFSGYCRDDSKLENSFRKYDVWQNVTFNFTRNGSAIKFNIDGDFKNE